MTTSVDASSSVSDSDQAFMQINALVPYITSYLPHREVDTVLTLVNRNFKKIVYEHYPRSEFHSCDHCTRKFCTKAKLIDHEGICCIEVGRAEEDDTHLFLANDDGIDEEKDAVAVEPTIESSSSSYLDGYVQCKKVMLDISC
jgi:hypothetical protein